MKEQLHRIQQKLAQAKEADKNLEVFGADAHQYHLNPPVSEAEVLAFEEKYGVQLPECYRAFMLTIGDTKAKRLDTMAGPYYGLYAFGTSVDSLLCGKTETYLKAPCNLSPDMTQEEWEQLTDGYCPQRKRRRKKTKITILPNEQKYLAVSYLWEVRGVLMNTPWYLMANMLVA